MADRNGFQNKSEANIAHKGVNPQICPPLITDFCEFFFFHLNYNCVLLSGNVCCRSQKKKICIFIFVLFKSTRKKDRKVNHLNIEGGEQVNLKKKKKAH